jgi:organic radical activating enzyme
MMNGEMPEPCKLCYKMESLGNQSKRTIESKRLDFSYDDALKITSSDGTLNEVNFEFIELRLGNHCNLACRTCNPASSTKWLADWIKIEGKDEYVFPQSVFNWPLDASFWDELSAASKSTKYIYINGGEPLLIDKHRDYLQKLIDMDVAHNIELIYSTNMTVINNTYEDVWPKFKRVQLMFSIDDLEERNQYIRYPAKWQKIMDTTNWITSLNQKYPNIQYNILQTVSILNIFYLAEFEDFWRDKVPHISINFVTDPDYYNPQHLPHDVKLKCINKLKGYACHDTVKNFLNADGDPNMLFEFFEITRKLDEIRREDFKKTFPELYEMIGVYDV